MFLNQSDPRLQYIRHILLRFFFPLQLHFNFNIAHIQPQSLCNTLAQLLQYIRAASTSPQSRAQGTHTHTRSKLRKATKSYEKHTYIHSATQSAHTHHGYRSLPPLKHATTGTTLCARPHHARRSHGSSSSSPSKRYLKQPLKKPPS